LESQFRNTGQGQVYRIWANEKKRCELWQGSEPGTGRNRGGRRRLNGGEGTVLNRRAIAAADVPGGRGEASPRKGGVGFCPGDFGQGPGLRARTPNRTAIRGPFRKVFSNILEERAEG